MFFLFGNGVFAQGKYGHIKSDEILQAMPEIKQMKASLQKRQNEMEAQLKGMYADYQKRNTELEQYGMSMMQAVMEEKAMELQQLQERIAQYQESIEPTMAKLQEKLMKPINDKYLKIVNAVAKEGGYTFIFDADNGTLAYYPESTGDITPQVIKRLTGQ